MIWGFTAIRPVHLHTSRWQHSPGVIYCRGFRARDTVRGTEKINETVDLQDSSSLLVCLHWRPVDTGPAYQAGTVFISLWWMGHSQMSATPSCCSHRLDLISLLHDVQFTTSAEGTWTRPDRFEGIYRWQEVKERHVQVQQKSAGNQRILYFAWKLYEQWGIKQNGQ